MSGKRPLPPPKPSLTLYEAMGVKCLAQGHNMWTRSILRVTRDLNVGPAGPAAAVRAGAHCHMTVRTFTTERGGMAAQRGQTRWNLSLGSMWSLFDPHTRVNLCF